MTRAGLPFGVGFAFRPWRLSGRVVGVVLNRPGELDAIGAAAHAPPHQKPPARVVLFVKPPNTFVPPGGALDANDAPDGLVLGTSLAIVVGRTACAVREHDALHHVAGYALALEAYGPHASLYRPALRERARDASLAIGPVAARDAVGDLETVVARTSVDGAVVQTASFGGDVRPVARLLADISDFMTLEPGDVVLAGVAPGAPVVRGPAVVGVEADRLVGFRLKLGTVRDSGAQRDIPRSPSDAGGDMPRGAST